MITLYNRNCLLQICVLQQAAEVELIQLHKVA